MIDAEGALARRPSLEDEEEVADGAACTRANEGCTADCAAGLSFARDAANLDDGAANREACPDAGREIPKERDEDGVAAISGIDFATAKMGLTARAEAVAGVTVTYLRVETEEDPPAALVRDTCFVDGRGCKDDDEVPLDMVGRVRGRSVGAIDRVSLEDSSSVAG